MEFAAQCWLALHSPHGGPGLPDEPEELFEMRLVGARLQAEAFHLVWDALREKK